MNQVKKSDPNNKVAAENRKARFSYEILDTVEAGLVLLGTEVKPLVDAELGAVGPLASGEGRE